MVWACLYEYWLIESANWKKNYTNQSKSSKNWQSFDVLKTQLDKTKHNYGQVEPVPSVL